MSDKKYLTKLARFGMTEREAKLYLAMLEKREVTASELHRMSGVLRTKIYEILEQMVNKGFCYERVEGRRRFFHAVSPDDLKKTFEMQWDIEYEQKKKSAESLFNSLSKIQCLSHESQPFDFIEVVRSRDVIHQKYLELLQNTTHSILAFNRSPFSSTSEEMMKRQEEVLREKLKQGIEVKTIYMVEDNIGRIIDGHRSKASEWGEKSRVIDYLPVKFFVFDLKIVMMAMKSQNPQKNTDFTMLVIEDEGFAEACQVLFDVYWERGKSEK